MAPNDYWSVLLSRHTLMKFGHLVTSIVDFDRFKANCNSKAESMQ